MMGIENNWAGVALHMQHSAGRLVEFCATPNTQISKVVQQ
jgi:hypothetical protein